MSTGSNSTISTVPRVSEIKTPGHYGHPWTFYIKNYNIILFSILKCEVLYMMFYLYYFIMITEHLLLLLLGLFYIFLASYDLVKGKVEDVFILIIIGLVGILGIYQGNLLVRFSFMLFSFLIFGLVDQLGGGDWKLLGACSGLFSNLWLVLAFLWLFFCFYVVFTLVVRKSVFDRFDRSVRVPLIPFIVLSNFLVLFFL